ncbi:MAG TPA: hypothetical protein DHV48_20940 [Prolixibacteraceae bacterium]|nr:hypothetical protein [Prolixibacteraceae bacterium]
MENSRYLHIFEQSPIAIELYNFSGRLVDANRACFNLFGVENTEELNGFNLFDDPNLPPQMLADLKAGKSVRHEFLFDFDLVKEKKLYTTSRNGKCYLDCFINPINNADQVPEGYTVYVMEITDRKNAEILLEEKSDELYKLNFNKDKFFSIIAHDLKNPFSAIIGFSDLMLKNFNSLDDETLLKGLNTIESAAKHAYKLLENLLIWSRTQTGRIKFNPEILNLKTQIEKIIRESENSAISKDIRLSSSIRKNHMVFADKEMIETILQNLITNAIKFSNRGGKVRISASTNNNNVEVTVSDSGVGIVSDHLKNIFEIDTRTNTADTDNEFGTGLGLVLCKDFLIRHGGRIWVESIQGKGSRFTFTLPLYEKQVQSQL